MVCFLHARIAKTIRLELVKMESSESSDSDMDWTNEEDDFAAQSQISTREEGGKERET